MTTDPPVLSSLGRTNHPALSSLTPTETAVLTHALRHYSGPHPDTAAQLLRTLTGASPAHEPLSAHQNDLLRRHPLPGTRHVSVPLKGTLTAATSALERAGWTVTQVTTSEYGHPLGLIAQRPLTPHWSYVHALELGMADQHPWLLEMLYQDEYVDVIEALAKARAPITWRVMQDVAAFTGPLDSQPGTFINNGMHLYPTAVQVLHATYPDLLRLPPDPSATLGHLAPGTHGALYATLNTIRSTLFPKELLLIPEGGNYSAGYVPTHPSTPRTVKPTRNGRVTEQPLPEVPGGTYVLAPGFTIQTALMPGAWIPYR